MDTLSGVSIHKAGVNCSIGGVNSVEEKSNCKGKRFVSLQLIPIRH